jgi:D-alanine-D-alanine ligase
VSTQLSTTDASIDVRALGKVAVLMGGTSAEREVSLMSGTGVLAALKSRGVDAHAFDPAERDLHHLKAEGFNRCFITLHGRGGEDGATQGSLELLGLPYTGSGVMASAIAMDKVMTKRVWSTSDLPTPKHVRLGADERTPQHLQRVLDTLGLPLIVKPPREGSSIGITKVTQAADFQAAVDVAARYDADLLCEAFIQGAELTCPVLGEGANAYALPVVKIMAPEGAYDYQNKYFTDTVKYGCPSGLPEAVEQQVRALAVAAYRSLGCRGWGRADFMLDERSGQAYLLEMNTSPGMTGHSLVPISAKAAGISYEELCVRIAAMATLDSAAVAKRAASV